jgi:hypothetical protein
MGGGIADLKDSERLTPRCYVYMHSAKGRGSWREQAAAVISRNNNRNFERGKGAIEKCRSQKEQKTDTTHAYNLSL